MAQGAEPHTCVPRADGGQRQEMIAKTTLIHKPSSSTSLQVEDHLNCAI
jgi:hypothetical protein